ncbi:hypothetical protein [Pyrococcus yayanosii]|nr:hypothetical protein [Pyrococcus yayanosii]
MKLLLLDFRYLVLILSFISTAMYLQCKGLLLPLNTPEDRAFTYLFFSPVVILLSMNFRPEKFGKIFGFIPKTILIELLKTLISFVSILPIYISLLLMTSKPVSIVALILLSSFLFSTFTYPSFRLVAFIVGLCLAFLDSLAMLASYLGIAILVFIGPKVYERIIDVYFLASFYTTTLGRLPRLLIFLAGIAIGSLVGYVSNSGCLVVYGPVSFYPACPPDFFVLPNFSWLSILITALGTVLFLVNTLLWKLLLIPDAYLDSYFTYLHKLVPEGYLRRSSKELLLYGASLLTIFSFYVPSFLMDTLPPQDIVEVAFQLAFFRTILVAVLPNIEKDVSFTLYLSLTFLPYFLPKPPMIEKTAAKAFATLLILSILPLICHVRMSGGRGT